MIDDFINLDMKLELNLNKEVKNTLLRFNVIRKNEIGESYKLKEILKNTKDDKIININNSFKISYKNFYEQYNNFYKVLLKENCLENDSIILNNDEEVEVLKFFENCKFDLIVNGKKYLNKKILNRNLDLKFKLFVDEDKVKLTQISDIPDYSTNNFEYFLLSDDIYKPETMQSFRYSTFYKNFNTLKSSTLTFKNKNLEKTIGLISFKLKEVSNYFYIEKPKNKESQPLKVDFYIDSNANEITVNPIFTYGDIVIDICSEDKFIQSKKVSSRDLDKEKKVNDVLKKCNFDMRKIGFVLDNTKDIVDFILHGEEKLKELGTIHKSDDFKCKKVYKENDYEPIMDVYNEYIEFSLGIEEITFEDINNIFNAIENEEKIITMKNGSYIYLNNKKLFKIYEGVGSRNFSSSKSKNGTFLVSRIASVFVKGGSGNSHTQKWRKTANDIAENEANNKLYIEKKEKLKEFIYKIESVEDDFKLPKNLQGVIRNYQIVGFKWLKTLALRNLGGILADEMGLGKTLQAICLILDYVENSIDINKKCPSIVVAPTSLIYNWENEILKFAPNLKICVIYGLAKERRELFKTINEYDVVVTSYSTLAKDIDYYNNIEFQYSFIDEGQQIKNSNTLNAKAVKLINAKAKFALTGTPIENSLLELWSIFDYIMPGYLLSKSKFYRGFQYPIEKFGDKAALDTLNEIIRPFILRRMKKDVLLELPEKIEQQIIIDMPSKQKRAYDVCLKNARNLVQNEIEDKGINKSQIHIFSLLTRLRQVCCDPAVVLDEYNGPNGKMEILKSIVRESISNGSKILIFSQFVTMLENIKNELDSEGVDTLILTGKTKVKDRLSLVEKFNEGEQNVFLISLKAGGYGLNLTSADVVIHFDPWWNPAVESQATDRAHRIGQDKTVKVYKLITKGTIEERIIKLHSLKRNIIDNVLKDKNSEGSFISSLSKREIEQLFS
ncbi:DEAD/DEAH box helicase [Clostridium senegalense]|uniref:DEAD/DEAH box helicase n=1 Tax=Clostridium senegalense TaxID=1465809 RepID=UPI001C117840|nr:SNF2-related protein [Clostridium senegalense]MBU5228178.1 SNF2 helicase associated domain-containing protein [Clostridium senegalense]